jgi:hypothetical protein
MTVTFLVKVHICSVISLSPVWQLAYYGKNSRLWVTLAFSSEHMDLKDV